MSRPGSVKSASTQLATMAQVSRRTVARKSTGGKRPSKRLAPGGDGESRSVNVSSDDSKPKARIFLRTCQNSTVSTRYCCIEGDQKVSEKHGLAYSQDAFRPTSELRARRVQDTALLIFRLHR